MTRILLLVEGQTEETFVKRVLTPHFLRRSQYIKPIIAKTSPGRKGGVVSYGKIRSQLIHLCRTDGAAWVSTMLDLYGLPEDFPGKNGGEYPANASSTYKAEYLESCLEKDIGVPNLIPNLMVHEFEALLFTQPKAFNNWIDDESVASQLDDMAKRAGSPEDINDDPTSAPSKRIMKVMPTYRKALHGPAISNDIGLDTIRESCAHFNARVCRLEAL